MFSSPPYYQKPNTRRSSSLFSNYFNTGTLVIVILVALGFLSTVWSNKSETKDSGPGESIKTEIVIDNHQDNTHPVAEAARQKMSSPLIAWAFVDRMVNAFRDAFNDPSLIEYAKQQGLDVTDSPTAPLTNSSSQLAAPSKSSLSQSGRSSSSY